MCYLCILKIPTNKKRKKYFVQFKNMLLYRQHFISFCISVNRYHLINSLVLINHLCQQVEIMKTTNLQIWTICKVYAYLLISSTIITNHIYIFNDRIIPLDVTTKSAVMSLLDYDVLAERVLLLKRTAGLYWFFVKMWEGEINAYTIFVWSSSF